MIEYSRMEGALGGNVALPPASDSLIFPLLIFLHYVATLFLIDLWEPFVTALQTHVSVAFIFAMQKILIFFTEI